ncbi:MAG: hypothetical protein CM15mP86_11130 [Gammaproteobacteria bacterium]|nr:MAG: hypothetical protein CM15mP86_11130 [Gammaproteobacteria bacterium]
MQQQSAVISFLEKLTTCQGAWIGSAGFEDIWDIFGDGISLPMENSLLSNLDSQESLRRRDG